MNLKQLQKIKKSLPKGYRLMLSEGTGYSASHIDHVLAGRRINESIVNAAIELLEKHLATLKQKKQWADQVLIKIQQQ